MIRSSQVPLQESFYRIGSFVLIVASLYFAREVFIPLALGLLISFLLRPVVNWFQRLRIGRVPAVLLTFGITLLLISGLLYQVGSEIASLVNDLPRYKTELVSKLKGIQVLGRSLDKSIGSVGKDLSSALNADGETEQKETEGRSEVSIEKDRTAEATSVSQSDLNQSKSPQTNIPTPSSLIAGSTSQVPLFVTEVKRPSVSWQSWAESAGIVAGPLGTGGLVVVFALFLMVYQDDLRDRTIKVVSGGEYVTTTRAINESAERISSYLLAQAIVNGSYGAVVSLGLWIIGATLGDPQAFPNFLLWGVLCAILRFIPYIGPVVSSLFPLAIALTVFPGFKVFLAVLVLIVVVELLSNNVMEPWLYGSSTGISAMAVIFAAVFWGWIWGPVGLLLATPLTVCLVVLGKHVEAFRVFRTLFGEDEPLSIATRFYQRLLARDAVQALELARREIEELGRLHFWDSTFVPAVGRIRKDRHSNRLDHQDELALNTVLKEVLTAIDDLDRHDVSKEQSKSQRQSSSSVAPELKLDVAEQQELKGVRNGGIMLLPSHHAYEEMVLKLMSSELTKLGLDSYVESPRTSPKQLQLNLRKTQPRVVVIGVIPPGGILQTEYLCETVRESAPQARILVCWLSPTKHFDRLLLRLRRSGVSYVPTSIEQTFNYIDNILDSSPATVADENDAKATAMEKDSTSVASNRKNDAEDSNRASN